MNDVELFWEELMQENLPIWQQCLDSDFLQQMGKGTLSEDCLKGYMVDDSLYLREYAKVFALGMLKAKDMETKRTPMRGTSSFADSLRAFSLPGENVAVRAASDSRHRPRHPPAKRRQSGCPAPPAAG